MFIVLLLHLNLIANRMKLQQEVIYKKVCECLEQDKVFLDPHLSLSRLSVIVGTNTTYLSNAINKRFGCNFHTLVNDYRVRYAVEIIRADEKLMRVKDLHSRCGFSSVSVFYDAFRRYTGSSPLQLKRRLDQQGGAVAENS